MTWVDRGRPKRVVAADLVWTGQEILHLRRFRDNLNAARALLGQRDDLAYSFLEDALEDLHRVLGEAAAPVASGAARTRASRNPAN